MIERAIRLQQLQETLLHAREPMTGNEIATQFEVTRQVVVHDIALLRAQGIAVVSTPRGYLISSQVEGQKYALIAVCHQPEQTADELYVLVDFGIIILDVQIEHPVYGQLTGSLQLSSRRDVELFMAKITTHKAALLSSLTGGYHFHRVEYPNSQRLEEAIRKLKASGIEVFD